MSFRLLGIPVEVSSGFWIIALLFGVLQGSITLFIITPIIVLLAVLLHEFGHALVARAFGAEPTIVLHRFGGTTSFRIGVLSRWQSILTTIAGPLVGILVGIGLFFVGRQVPNAPEDLRRAIDTARFCTLGWSLLNLLPVLPLDGGLIVRDLLGPSRLRATLIISAIAGALITLGFASIHQYLPAVIFGFAAARSARDAWEFRDMIDARRQELIQVVRALESAENAVERGYFGSAEATASEILTGIPIPALRDRARRILVAIEIQRLDGARALELLAGLENVQASDVILHAQALDVAGRQEDAFSLLRANLDRDESGSILRALIQGLSALGRTDEVDALLRAHPSAGTPAREPG